MKKLFILVLTFFLESNGFCLEAEKIYISKKDYPLRTIGNLSITNPKGNTTVYGWTLDKIRIEQIKRIVPDSSQALPSSLEEVFSEVDYRYSVKDQNIEISTSYNKEIDIQKRISKQRNNSIRQDFVIYAPTNLDLKIWAMDGNVTVKSWGKSIDARSKSGVMKFDEIRGKKISIDCDSCLIQMNNIRSNVRCSTHNGEVNLKNIRSHSIYVETHTGNIQAQHLEGKQTYSIHTGKIFGYSLIGNVEFFARNADVDFKNLIGFLSGYVEKGNITASIKEWNSYESSIIEAEVGDISLLLPKNFAGELDLWSMLGSVAVNFNLQKIVDMDREEFGPQPSNKILGRVREGGNLLKVFTKFGKILINKN